jgi:Cdc6-like AAA superfamily ATPase
VYSLANNVNKGVGALREDNHAAQVRTWLSPPDPSVNFNKALKQRHQGSGQRLIQCNKYSSWRKGQSSFLWLYGIPGCGKTILSSTVIEHLSRSKHPSSALLYYYFDFTVVEKQNFDNAVRTLIGQIYNQMPSLQGFLDALYASCESGKRQPSDDALRRILQTMIQQAGEVWIVLDALDECQRREEFPDVGLLSWIKDLHKCHSNIHLLVTSRPEQDIKRAIERWAGSENIIQVQSDLVESDIQDYIHARVRGDGELKRWQSRPNVQSEIEATLIKKADGM